MIWCRYQIYDILVYKVLLSIEHGYTMIYIYINIYPYKLWSILDVTCDQQEASAAVTWKNMEPLKRVFALGRFGSKIWDYPGPKALPKKKNILLEFLTTINPKKKWLWNSENYPLRTELRHNMFATNRCHGVAQYSNCIHLLMPG